MEMPETRKQQAENTKKRIIDTTSNLLKNKTLDEISIQEICKASKVSVGSFYHHFSSKDSIIIEIYKTLDDQFEKSILNSIDKTDPIKAIIDYILSQCIHTIDAINKNIIKNIFKVQVDTDNLFYLSNDRGFPRGIKYLLTLAKSQNILRDDANLDELLTELLIISRGIVYHWCVISDDEALTKYATNIITNYLKAYSK